MLAGVATSRSRVISTTFSVSGRPTVLPSESTNRAGTVDEIAGSSAALRERASGEDATIATQSAIPGHALTTLDAWKTMNREARDASPSITAFDRASKPVAPAVEGTFRC